MDSSAGVLSGLGEEGRGDAATAKAPVHPRVGPGQSRDEGACSRSKQAGCYRVPSYPSSVCCQMGSGGWCYMLGETERPKALQPGG